MKGAIGWLFGLTIVALSMVTLPSYAAEKLAPLPDPPKVNPAQAKLGMYLFFDPRLSGDGAIRCASCHDPSKGWSNNEANDEELSDAYPGSEYFRNAKSPVNVVFAETVYWDGRLPGKSMLQVHVRDHITETHFMNMDGRLMQERIKQIPFYVKMFKEAWNAEPSFGKIRNSIREYEKTLVSRNVPFDKYLKGDKNALSLKAQRGLTLFTGKGCIRCHNGPMLSDYKPYNLGVPENPKIWDDPFRHFTLRSFQLALGVPGFQRAEHDVGYYVVSKKEEDIGKFVTPSRSITGRLTRSLFIAAGLVAIGVSLAYGWPWSTDMDIQPSIRPQEDPRLPPPGSIPRQGKEPPMDRLKAAEQLHNPVEPNAASVENGKRLFQIYCALCHGPDAKGGGPVATKFVPPPDLTLEIFRQRTDGFLYTTIRNGGALMPGQAEALSPRERWDVVNYIRNLQKK